VKALKEENFILEHSRFMGGLDKGYGENGSLCLGQKFKFKLGRILGRFVNKER